VIEEMKSKATAEDTRKHLEFIQAIISRLAGNSFLIKGWSVTVTGLILGFAVKEANPGIALVSLLSALTFWGLDGYYLLREQQYRSLYGKVITAPGEVPLFSLDYRIGPKQKTWWQVMWSVTIWPIYLGSIATISATSLALSGPLSVTCKLL
jgi:hypothetical protein